jgi:hypothetical protein
MPKKHLVTKSSTPKKDNRVIAMSLIIAGLAIMFALGKVFGFQLASEVQSTPAPVAINEVSENTNGCPSLKTEDQCNRFSSKNKQGNPAFCEWVAARALPSAALGAQCKEADCAAGRSGCAYQTTKVAGCSLNGNYDQATCTSKGGTWIPNARTKTTCTGTTFGARQGTGEGYCKAVK